jgi:hypothetical protein
MGMRKGKGRGITLSDGHYAVCGVASVHVSYETMHLAISVAIRVSVLRDCLSSMENDLVTLTILLELQDSKITQTRRPDHRARRAHTLIQQRLALFLSARTVSKGGSLEQHTSDRRSRSNRIDETFGAIHL